MTELESLAKRVDALESNELDKARRGGAAHMCRHIASQMDQVGFFDEIVPHRLANILRRWASKLDNGEWPF